MRRDVRSRIAPKSQGRRKATRSRPRPHEKLPPRGNPAVPTRNQANFQTLPPEPPCSSKHPAPKISSRPRRPLPPPTARPPPRGIPPSSARPPPSASTSSTPPPHRPKSPCTTLPTWSPHLLSSARTSSRRNCSLPNRMDFCH